MDGSVRLNVRRDGRGVVFEPLAAEQLAGMRNVHVVVTEPGHVRGNHFHARATEWMTVLGPARVRTRVHGRLEEAHVPEGEAWRFTFAPGVSHAVAFAGERPGVLVSFSDAAHDPADPDTVRDPLFTEAELGRR